MGKSSYCAKSMQGILDVPRCDRWHIQRRLSDLSIPSYCDRAGNLVVEVSNGVEIVQIHSVVRQVLAKRPQLASWLESCWSQPSVTPSAPVSLN
ncbi:Asr1405/Asl0597 family protein [Lyngbya confervoides]|uniref:Uncharacterized protein n=1 Tax=Lyngbya confervoides BDU141951 TaxID=1574623 RepID=A0ABD4T2Y9_9CYAN|nr:Asr1405/Asl0597 family protein [Lyngbya confervoides]MCM1982894.1 hypothetical protein [Lyngbya confervoides BDU141951]